MFIWKIDDGEIGVERTDEKGNHGGKGKIKNEN